MPVFGGRNVNKTKNLFHGFMKKVSANIANWHCQAIGTFFGSSCYSFKPAGFLTLVHRLDTPSQKRLTFNTLKAPCSNGFMYQAPYHSDRIVQDSDLIPFGDHLSGTGLVLLFSFYILYCSIKVIKVNGNEPF